MEKWYRKSTGFTMIELMIVILIIAILVAIAVPIYIAVTDNAKKRTCQANLRMIDGATEMFRVVNETGIYPLDPSDLVAFFKNPSALHCPSGNIAYAYSATHDASCENAPDHHYP